MKFAMTIVQAPCIEGHREANFNGIRGMVERTARKTDPEFLVLPELFAVGLNINEIPSLGAAIPGPTSDFISDLARERGSYVVGTGIERAGVSGRFFNTLVLADPDGNIIGTYRKIHPFQEEREVFAQGSHPVLFDLGFMRVGVLICYDIRFPEVARSLALAGAQLLLIPAAFPDPRAAHWDTLIQARAIENQLYVAAANRVGIGHDGKTYFGHSQVVDPWGLRLNRMTSEPEVFTVHGDTDAVHHVRDTITCFADRPSAYGEVRIFGKGR